MNTYCNRFIILILLPLFFCCKNEAPISYEDALTAIQPETITQNLPGGPITVFNHYEIEGIVGAQLPPFEATLLTGDTLREDYFAGKVSVINLWFIGCKPCEAELPGFNLLSEKYKADPVNFLAISRDSPQDLNEFFLEHPFQVDHIPHGFAIIEYIFQPKWGYPVTMVADQDKKIIAAFSGGRIDSLAVQELQDKLIPVIDGALR